MNIKCLSLSFLFWSQRESHTYKAKLHKTKFLHPNSNNTKICFKTVFFFLILFEDPDINHVFDLCFCFRLEPGFLKECGYGSGSECLGRIRNLSLKMLGSGSDFLKVRIWSKIPCIFILTFQYLENSYKKVIIGSVWSGSSLHW